MLVRLIAGSAIACALIAAGAAQADSAHARLLKGKTAQGYRIKLVAQDRKLKILKFEADLKCRDGSILTLIESGFLWTPASASGRFRDSQFGRTDSVYFRGRLTERRVRGRVRLTDRLGKRGPRCSSRWIAFNATAR